jgi:hypothetical protein
MRRGMRQVLIAAAAAALALVLTSCGGDCDRPVAATPTLTGGTGPTPTATPGEPPCTQCEENCGTGSSCGCFGHADNCACGLPSFDCPNGRFVLCSDSCKATCEQETSAPNSRATCNGVTFAEIDAQSMPGATQTLTFPSCRDCVWCCAPPA